MTKWANWGVLVVSIIIGALICEVALRILVPEIGWRQRRDTALGWASDEYHRFDPAAARSGRKRILFLGDSFLAGSGVSDLTDRFPVLLEGKLGQDRVEIAIFAAGGWGTDQQLLAFLQKGKPWKPDIVVLAFCANNDIANILSYRHGGNKYKPYFVLDGGGELMLYDGHGRTIAYDTVQRTIQPPERSKSYLVALVRYLITQRFGSDPEGETVKRDGSQADDRYVAFIPRRGREAEIYGKPRELNWSPERGVSYVSAYIHEDFPLNTYQWDLFEGILSRLKQEVEEAGGELVVMLLPVIFNPVDPATIAGGEFAHEFITPSGRFTFRSAEPRDRLEAICGNLGVDFLDPTREFAAIVVDNGLMKEAWPKPNNWHFSALGHEILADITHGYFSQKMAPEGGRQ